MVIILMIMMICLLICIAVFKDRRKRAVQEACCVETVWMLNCMSALPVSACPSHVAPEASTADDRL